nr:GSCFA domain-containing protein [Panacagrimonas sp.]
MRFTSKSSQDWGADRPHPERVRAAYWRVLDRAADSEGMAHWERFLARGGTFDALLQGFLKSPEFRRRLDAHGLTQAAPGQASASSVVLAAYRCLLGRDPEPEGRAHWQAILDRGGSMQEMLVGLVRSAEFTRRLDQPGEGEHNVAARSGEAQVVPQPVAPPPVAPEAPRAARAPIAAKRKTYAVIGNCQSAAMMRCVQALTGCEMPTMSWRIPEELMYHESRRAEVVDLFTRHEKVFIQPIYWQALSKFHPELADQVILYPTIAFAGYHPDVVYVLRKENRNHVIGPSHDYQSSIVFMGWKAGLSIERTIGLFNASTYERLGFFDTWHPAFAALIDEGRAAGIELGEFVRSWRRRGPFMRSMNHPQLHVSLDIAKAVLEKHGIRASSFELDSYVYDYLSTGAAWPVYPEVGQKLGIGGHYRFRLESPGYNADQPVRSLSLEEFVRASYQAFSRYSRDELECDRLQSGRYRAMLDELLAEPKAEAAAVTEPPVPASVGIALRYVVLGNRQAMGMARCLQALLGGPMPHAEVVPIERLTEWESDGNALLPVFAAHDKVFMQPWIWKRLSQRYRDFESQVVLYPSVAFSAYHPDLVDIQVKRTATALTQGPLEKCHSSLALLGWKAGLGISQTAALFRGEVLQRLGFFDWWESSETALLEEGRAAHLSLAASLARWKAKGCFMHFPAHPKLFVLADIARAVLERLGVAMQPFEFTELAHDHLADDVAWPVYTELGANLGCRGSYEFKQRLRGVIDFSPVSLLSLEQFIEQSFATFARFEPDELLCRRLDWPAYQDVLRELKDHGTVLPPQAATVDEPEAPVEAARSAEAVSSTSSSHPYSGLPAHHFWRKAIQSVPPAMVDPVVRTKFKIEPDTKVATAGSCFALNISRRLLQRGYNFLQAEPGEGGPEDAVEGVGGMGLFSARFGYVYTARQLRQLMERAYGRFVPQDAAWTLETGRWVDPFRPRVEPGGFASAADVEAARSVHLAAVRRMFESLDVMVFTLGMTEAWRARSDGAVFSVAPGVAGGQMDFDRYEFVNFTAAEVDADLQAFIEALRKVNPHARVILTVSPVPILATYVDRHILVSSTYTKSVLRVAAEQVMQRHDFCDYFPGYELVNSSFHRGSYIAEDLRSVTPEGVDHVMRLFFAHYAGDGATAPVLDAEMLAEARKNLRVVCDEELLDAAIR